MQLSFNETKTFFYYTLIWIKELHELTKNLGNQGVFLSIDTPMCVSK